MTNLKKKIAIMAVAAPLAVTLTAGCVPNNPVTPAPVQRVAEAVSAPAQVYVPSAPATSSATSTPTMIPTQPVPAPAPAPEFENEVSGEVQAAEIIIIYTTELPPGVCKNVAVRGMGGPARIHRHCGI